MRVWTIFSFEKVFLWNTLVHTFYFCLFVSLLFVVCNSENLANNCSILEDHPGQGGKGQRCLVTLAAERTLVAPLLLSSHLFSSFTPTFCQVLDNGSIYFQTWAENIVSTIWWVEKPTHPHPSIPMKPSPPFCPFLDTQPRFSPALGAADMSACQPWLRHFSNKSFNSGRNIFQNI